ncbi:hypothetical protein D3C71_1927370 [compost metagenome]
MNCGADAGVSVGAAEGEAAALGVGVAADVGVGSGVASPASVGVGVVSPADGVGACDGIADSTGEADGCELAVEPPVPVEAGEAVTAACSNLTRLLEPSSTFTLPPPWTTIMPS